MTKRYEIYKTDCDMGVITPDTAPAVGYDGEGPYTLVLGDPQSSAFAVEGSLDDLRAFARRAADLVQSAQHHATLRDLRGSMADGYDHDQVNLILGRISAHSGLSLVCVWDCHDHVGFGGDSQFYVQADNGQLYELAGDLWTWLNGDTDDSDPAAAVLPGTPRTWTGHATAMTTSGLAYHDGAHNYARRDDLKARTAFDEAAECTCVVSCADDPATSCTLSGTRHVHPLDAHGNFGRCPEHPDAPGDL